MISAPIMKEKTPYIKKYAEKAAKKTSDKTLAYFPLIFLAWDYYNTGSFIHSCITCCRDFLWPAAVVVAKYCNASPY